jgi:Spy/CpxP family protein refolding chaperone
MDPGRNVASLPADPAGLVDRVHQADCRDFLAKMPAGWVDLILDDPPYNLQLQQELWRPTMTRVDAVEEGLTGLNRFLTFPQSTFNNCHVYSGTKGGGTASPEPERWHRKGEPTMRSWWQDRKKRRITMGGLLGLTAVLAGLISTAVAQPGPGGRPGGRAALGAPQAMMFLERTWAAVAFEIKASQEQLVQLYPAYQEAWEARKKAQQEAREKQDRTLLRNALQQIQTDLQAKLKEVLTPEQSDQLQQWLQEQAQLLGPRAGRRPQ